jgi:hypothetical protein
LANNDTDKRLKMIEVVLTLGGFLGIIIALQQDVLVAQAKATFSVLIVMFMIFAFFAYASVAIPLTQKAIKLFLRAFSAIFSVLLAFALTIPLASQAAPVFTLTAPLVGIVEAIVIYAVFVLGITYVVFFFMAKIVMTSFERMEPKQSEDS